MGAYKTACLATTGIALFWDLDDTGATAADSQGSNTGTYAGTYTQSVPGESGNGVTFNGSTGFVKTATLPTTATANTTLECWFKTSNAALTQQCILYLGNNSPGSGYGLFLNGNGATDGRVGGLYQGIRWFGNATPIVRAGEWHHLALVQGGTNKPFVYLDGLLAYADAGTNPVTPAGALAAGACGPSGSSFFAGTVDGVAVYTAGVSAADILAHYKAGELSYKGPNQFPSRPPAPLAIDRGNTLAAGLVVAAPLGMAGGNTRNVIDGSVLASVNSPFWAAGRYSAAEWLSTRGTNHSPQFTHRSVPQRSFTVEVWATVDAFTATNPYISALWTSLSGGDIVYRFGDTNVSWAYLEVALGTAGTVYPAARVVSGVPHQFTMVGDGSSVKVYLDGVLVATGAAANNVSFSTSTCFDDGTGLSARVPDGQLHQYHLWGRPLSAAEVLDRWIDPWGLYDTPTIIPSQTLRPVVIGAPLLTCL